MSELAKLLKSKLSHDRCWTNDRGNLVTGWSFIDCLRYTFDFKYCHPDKGWKQYDTNQDASYFGVWVHVESRETLTFAEGDLMLCECPTRETFAAELADMERCYGKQPPCAVGIGADGSVEHFYDPRPTA